MKLITLHDQETELLGGGRYMNRKGNGRPKNVGTTQHGGNSNGGNPTELIPSISSSPITIGWKSLQFVAVNGGTNVGEDFETDDFNFFS
jgi:hypothetical protein